MLSENVRMALLVIDDWEVLTALVWVFAEVLMGFIYSKDTTEQSICFDDRGFWRFVLFFNFRDFLPFCGPPQYHNSTTATTEDHLYRRPS